MKLGVALRSARWGLSYLGKLGLGRRPPMVGGIAINDTCNLRCRHCTVGRGARPDMTFEEVRSVLGRLRALEVPLLFIEGGEPFLWKDGRRSLEDVVALARDLGFLYTMIYTNGTRPIDTSADSVFVSIDGLRQAHDDLRGRSYDLILSNILASRHERILVNYTINRHNERDLEELCYQVSKIENVRGVFFYFYTPDGEQPDTDRELYLDLPARRRVVDRLVALKRQGGRVLNSTAGLRVAVSDRWRKPDSLGRVYAGGRLYECCRHIGEPEICENCGYLGFAELYLLSRLDPRAMLAALAYT